MQIQEIKILYMKINLFNFFRKEKPENSENLKTNQFFMSPYDVPHEFKWRVSAISNSGSESEPEFRLSSKSYPCNITFSNFDSFEFRVDIKKNHNGIFEYDKDTIRVYFTQSVYISGKKDFYKQMYDSFDYITYTHSPDVVETNFIKIYQDKQIQNIFNITEAILFKGQSISEKIPLSQCVAAMEYLFKHLNTYILTSTLSVPESHMDFCDIIDNDTVQTSYKNELNKIEELLNKFKKEEKNVSDIINTTQEEIETISKLYDSFQSELLNLKAKYRTKTQIEIDKFVKGC